MNQGVHRGNSIEISLKNEKFTENLETLVGWREYAEWRSWSKIQEARNKNKQTDKKLS